MNRNANQYLTSISIGKQYFPFYLAIIVLKAVKYLIIGLTAKERPVTMTTVKAIGFLFSRIMNFSPLCVTLPLHSQPLRLEWSLSILEIPRFCLIICQTREKQRGKKKFNAQQMQQFRPGHGRIPRSIVSFSIRNMKYKWRGFSLFHTSFISGCEDIWFGYC